MKPQLVSAPSNSLCCQKLSKHTIIVFSVASLPNFEGCRKLPERAISKLGRGLSTSEFRPVFGLIARVDSIAETCC